MSQDAFTTAHGPSEAALKGGRVAQADSQDKAVRVNPNQRALFHSISIKGYSTYFEKATLKPILLVTFQSNFRLIAGKIY